LVFPTGGEPNPTSTLAFSDNQVRFTNMMIDLLGSLSGTKYVLIRGFAMNEDDVEGIQEARKKMAVVKSLLQNPSQLQQAKPYSGGDDLLNMGASIGTSVSSFFGGGSAGTTQELTQMRLPNNLPVTPIAPEKIIEQISYFKRSEVNEVGEIQCLDRNLYSAISQDKNDLFLNEQNLGFGSRLDGIFPKGGPSQSAWLDLRNLISGVNIKTSFKSNVVEVGVISIPSSLVSKAAPNTEES